MKDRREARKLTWNNLWPLRLQPFSLSLSLSLSLYISRCFSLLLDATHTKRELSSSLPQHKIGSHFKLKKREALQTVHDRRDTLKKESSVDSPRQKRYLQKGPRNWDRHARSCASPPPSSPPLPPPLLVARRALSGAGAGKKDDDAATLHIPHHNGCPHPTVPPHNLMLIWTGIVIAIRVWHLLFKKWNGKKI